MLLGINWAPRWGSGIPMSPPSHALSGLALAPRRRALAAGPRPAPSQGLPSNTLATVPQPSRATEDGASPSRCLAHRPFAEVAHCLASVEAGRPGQYVFRPRGRRLYGASRLVGDRRWGSQVRAYRRRRTRAVEQPVRPRGAQCYWGSSAPGTAAGESRLIARTVGAG